MLIDIHTHKLYSDHTLAISNLIEQNLNSVHLPSHHTFSYSLHPWYLSNHTMPRYMERLHMASLQENCVAIGECGLDKLRGVSLHQQMDWLHEILSLPIDKPIILHCVRAHEELLSIIKQYPHQYIIHGFRKGTSLAQKYLALGYSLSLGIEGLDLLNTIGKEASFFLETDTAPWHISEVYLKACSLLNLDIDTLATLIETRFRITFATWPRIGKNAQD